MALVATGVFASRSPGEAWQRHSTRVDDLVISYALPPGSIVLHECDAEASASYADPPDFQAGRVICMAYLTVDPRAYSPPSSPSFYLAVIEYSEPGQGPRSSGAFLAERKKKAVQE